MLRYAMHYGALLGLFWIFKYLFRIGAGFSDHIFIFLYYLLAVGTFLLFFVFSVKFVTSDPERHKGVLQCLLFVVLICFFASFFEAVIEYAHYTFIDPAYFSRMIAPLIDSIDGTRKLFPMSDTDFEQAKKINAAIFSNKITYIIMSFIRNIFLGIFLGLLLGFLLRPRKKV